MARLQKRDPWHLFESHAAATSTREGKRYKDWIFSRTEQASDPPAGVIEAGGSLILRSVVREHLRTEFLSRDVVSLNTPVKGGDGESLTLEDLLPGSPDPADEVAAREYAALAGKHARHAFDDMPWRERVALLAKHMGLSLSCDRVLKAAGCGKSVLSVTYRESVQRIGLDLRARYPQDDEASVLALAMMTMDHLKKRIFSWGKSEKGCSDLFHRVEGTVDQARQRGRA